MKVDEFIEKVNENDHMSAKERGAVITVYDEAESELISIPLDATNWLETHARWYSLQETRWYNFQQVLNKRSREYLSALVEDFLHTPIERRFSQKKWYLCIGKNSQGDKIYLQKNNIPRAIVTTINKDCLAYWTDEELEKLKVLCPNLNVDAMKEEVEDE